MTESDPDLPPPLLFTAITVHLPPSPAIMAQLPQMRALKLTTLCTPWMMSSLPRDER